MTVLLGNGSGGFSPAPGSPLAVGEWPISVAVGDFNGDGHFDLAVADHNINAPSAGAVSVLLGNGSGGFSAAPGSPFAVGNNPSSVAVGDFNGDGHSDLAVANFEGNSVSVLLGNGSGGFSAASGSPFAVGQYPTSVAVGDFNGDGHPDLAVANAGGASVSVLLGNGSGGFSAAPGSPFAVGNKPVSMAVGDFNGDGYRDLAVANESGNSVSVLLGNGSGGFSAAPGSPFAVGVEPSSVAVGDLNGDGHVDLAVVNHNNNEPSTGSVSVLLGDGSGGFTPALGSPFAVGGRSTSVAAGDFNGDGAPDLAVAESQLGRVWVLLNMPPHTSITSGPSGTTRLTTATFSFTSQASAPTFQCQLDAGVWATCASPMTYSALISGAHTFRVRAIDEAGNVDPTGATSSWSVDLSTLPSAALAVSPNPVLTGVPVTLDASASHDPFGGTIVDYKWDLSGSGSFTLDTGTNPTTSSTYAVAGIAHPRVQVTDALGITAITTANVDVRPAPPPGAVGVSINNGDYATNTTAVQVYVVWPAFASNALVSNDGGFNTAGGTSTRAARANDLVDAALGRQRTAAEDRLLALSRQRVPDGDVQRRHHPGHDHTGRSERELYRVGDDRVSRRRSTAQDARVPGPSPREREAVGHLSGTILGYSLGRDDGRLRRSHASGHTEVRAGREGSDGEAPGLRARQERGRQLVEVAPDRRPGPPRPPALSRSRVGREAQAGTSARVAPRAWI